MGISMSCQFRCSTCDHYICAAEHWYGSYGKCKILRLYDGTIEVKVGMFIEKLGCASHSSIKNIEVNE
jgi:hypothetical protein